MMETNVAGEILELFPERAVFWRGTRTLLVADPHFGKAAAFRAAGVFVPEATTGGTLGRLSHLISETNATRVVFLGDFLHAKEGRHPDTLRAIREWRGANRDVDMLLVRGNHDKRAGDPPEDIGIACVDGPVIEPPFALAHHPIESASGYVLAGHLHPAVSLSGGGRQHARLPCFWFRRDVGVLPAFGEFTGVADIAPADGDRVFVVAGDQVVAK